jgi:L-aspartate oxidase
LLEGIVYSHRAAQDIKKLFKKTLPIFKAENMDNNRNVQGASTVFVQEWQEIRRLTWNYLGISRSDETLQKAQKRIDIMKDEVLETFWNSPITVERIELKNIAFIAEMIVRCAMLRKESRGLHYNEDYPFALKEAKDTIITAIENAQRAR